MKTSILEYLQLLKQINHVPPSVKAVAIQDIEKIKKDRIYIPDATIRKSFNKSDRYKKIKRHNEYQSRNDESESETENNEWGEQQNFKKKFWETKKFDKTANRKFDEQYYNSDSDREEIFI